MNENGTFISARPSRGGGFDYFWKPRITIRVVQADYINSNTFGVTQNDVRVSTGIVINFGHIGHHPRL